MSRYNMNTTCEDELPPLNTISEGNYLVNKFG